jgi:hypothetical protein
VALDVFRGLAVMGGPADDEVLPTVDSEREATEVDPEGLKKLRAVGKHASAELLVMFGARLEDRIGAAITTTDKYVSKEVHASADALMTQFRQESETSAGSSVRPS